MEQELLTNEQILAEIERLSAPQDQKPSLKIGDKEYALDNPQALQTALDAEFARNKTEFTTLREKVDQLQNTRVVKPTDDQTPPQSQQTQQTQQSQPRQRRAKVTDKDWTDRFVASPQDALKETIDNALSEFLGVDAPGSEALRGIFNGIGTELQKQQLITKALLEKQQQLDEKITNAEAFRDAQAFIDSTPEYEINADNQKVMESYLTEYGLPATQKNLSLVFSKAVADGKIAPAQSQQNQQVTQQQQAPRRQGVPQLGRGGPTSIDEQYIVDQANNMPIDKHAALIERLRQGQFSR